MDNQHRAIAGYRELSEQEIALINEGKELAERVGAFCERLGRMTYPIQEHATLKGLYAGPDKRWLAIATTDLQKGFMALIRSIARPTNF